MKLNQCRYSKYIDEAGYATRLKFIFKFVIIVIIMLMIYSNIIMDIAFCDIEEFFRLRDGAYNICLNADEIKEIKTQARLLRTGDPDIRKIFSSLIYEFRGRIPLDLFTGIQIDLMDGLSEDKEIYANLNIFDKNTHKLIYCEAIGLRIDYENIDMNFFYNDPKYIFPMKKW